MRSLFNVSLITGAALALSHSALAQEKYPTKTVTIIVPQAAAGGNDAIARIVGHKLGELLGQQVAIDNRPGAGGNIGTAIAARAPKDGHSLLVTLSSAHVVNPSLF